MITGAGSGHASECVKHCVEANKINNLDRCYLVERDCLPHRSRAFELVIGIVFSCCHEKHYESNEKLSYQLNTMPAREIHVLIDQIINHLVIHLIFHIFFCSPAMKYSRNYQICIVSMCESAVICKFYFCMINVEKWRESLAKKNMIAKYAPRNINYPSPLQWTIYFILCS